MSSLFHVVLKPSCISLHSPTRSPLCSRPMQSTLSPLWSRTVTSTLPQDPILVITPRMPTTNKVRTEQVHQSMSRHLWEMQWSFVNHNAPQMFLKLFLYIFSLQICGVGNIQRLNVIGVRLNSLKLHANTKISALLFLGVFFRPGTLPKV